MIDQYYIELTDVILGTIKYVNPSMRHRYFGPEGSCPLVVEADGEYFTKDRGLIETIFTEINKMTLVNELKTPLMPTFIRWAAGREVVALKVRLYQMKGKRISSAQHTVLKSFTISGNDVGDTPILSISHITEE